MQRLGLVSLLLLAAASQASAQLERGQRLFDAHCARCHGMGGTGSEGPALTQAVLPRAPDDDTLAAIVRLGIEGTEMPGTWMLSKSEIGDIVRYVRSLGRLESEALTGNGNRGRELFEGEAGCAVCHIVGGEGGILGPDLTDIGARRGADHLREAMTDPGGSVAKGYAVVEAVTSDGREIIGLLVNEDSFTMQVRDEQGRFHSLRKLQLRDWTPKIGESLMPSYIDRLTAEEIEDVVAYLAELKGRREPGSQP